MRTLILITAAIRISFIMKKQVTGIQFEDGSNKKFNFQLKGDNAWFYIKLK